MQQVALSLVKSNQAWVFSCPELFFAHCNVLLWKCNCSVYMRWREQTYCSNSHVPIALLVKNLNKLLKLVLNSFLSIAFSSFSVSGQPGETQSPLRICPDRNVLMFFLNGCLFKQSSVHWPLWGNNRSAVLWTDTLSDNPWDVIYL